MAVFVRALGIGLAATAAYLLLTLGETQGDANIGAGLAVFAVLALGGFTWALFDGMDRRGSRAVRVGLREILVRWVIVSVLAVAIIVAVLVARYGAERLDLDASSAVFLWVLVLGPAMVGALIGYSARGTSGNPSGHTRSS
ncbi:hypothetical protein JNB_13748 [Janibacter sp. HTCC2649]|uniref:hypothetical protein n=1 Tax=Janibacter sp. HTCC2649 TaxID=313589 RepID=UPI000067194E|nr:hypothetical protein [Janibacter sp. HTCC2649]EAP98032.1 hypothetical protein JNB_13748 [Janibacter sp. HTCC2649]